MIVVGAAARDVVADDARGWRLGGAVAYAALTLARLGVPTTALIGLDPAAMTAWELDSLRAAGVEVVPSPLRRGPVFELAASAAGRSIRCVSASDRIDVASFADRLPDPSALVLVPIADELPAATVRLASPSTLVALGWQGLLRRLEPGQAVAPRPARSGWLVRRADVVVLSREDLAPGAEPERLLPLLRRDAVLVVTDGPRGGRVAIRVAHGGTSRIDYDAIPAEREIDSTGAGDVFLAALVAARLNPAAFRASRGLASELRVAAAAASLSVEARGLAGLPDLAAVRARMARA